MLGDCVCIGVSVWGCVAVCKMLLLIDQQRFNEFWRCSTKRKANIEGGTVELKQKV